MAKQLAEGQSAERVGLAVGECLLAFGQPVTFTAEELAAMPEKAQAFVKARLLAWFEAQQYSPNARAYAKRRVSVSTATLSLLEQDAPVSKLIGPSTKPAMIGTAKRLAASVNNNPEATKAEVRTWKRNRVARMEVWPR